MNVTVQLGDRSYDIAIQSGDARLGDFVRERAKGRLALVVADQNVRNHAETVAAEIASAEFQTRIEVLPPGEDQKSLASASRLYDRLAELHADRQTLVLPVGGGVIGDLAGFVAATYNRGLPTLLVPTTLLAMVDSSVGGKVGINHPRGKNLIGAFHQPLGVWINIDFLKSLPEREYRSGLAEVVKYGVILDAELFGFLEVQVDAILRREPGVVRDIIARCCRLKADIVEQDEYERTGLRMILNYGHTFAHAFEAVAGYGTWLHGEAVAAGIVCASRLAERRALIDSAVTRRQASLLSQFGLPVAPLPWPTDAIIKIMRHDKKARAGRLRFILPRRIGEVALFEDVPEWDVFEVLRSSVH